MEMDSLRFKSQVEVLKNRTFPTILTPHMGEMSRLLNKPIPEIEENKIDLLQVLLPSSASMQF